MKKIIALFTFLLSHCLLTAKTTVFFSPYDKPNSRLIKLIKNTRSALHVAMYCLTDKRIAQALIDAHNRGVEVTIVLDKFSTSYYGKADMLANAGLDVRIFQAKTKKSNRLKVIESSEENVVSSSDPSDNSLDDNSSRSPFRFEASMHSKYAIIDDELLWTGSANWSRIAGEKNWENVIMATAKKMIQSYQDNFTKLLKETEKYIPKQKKDICLSLREKIENLLSQEGISDEELSALLLTILLADQDA